jgi:hypothetical protein
LNKVSLSIDKEHFDYATEAYYYKLESDSFLAENNLSDDLNKAEEHLKEEEDRVDLYLHKATPKLLISKCEDILVRMHAELMLDTKVSWTTTKIRIFGACILYSLASQTV